MFNNLFVYIYSFTLLQDYYVCQRTDDNSTCITPKQYDRLAIAVLLLVIVLRSHDTIVSRQTEPVRWSSLKC